MEQGNCILQGIKGCSNNAMYQLNNGGAEKRANNNEWEVLDEFLAKAQGGKGGGDGVEDNKVLVKNAMLVNIKRPFLKEYVILCCVMGRFAWWPGRLSQKWVWIQKIRC